MFGCGVFGLVWVCFGVGWWLVVFSFVCVLVSRGVRVGLLVVVFACGVV